MQPRIAVVVLATTREPWLQFQQTQLATWGSSRPATVQIRWFYKARASSLVDRSVAHIRERLRYGRAGLLQRTMDTGFRIRLHRSTPTVHQDGDDLWVSVPDEIAYNGQAMIAAFRHLLREDTYDYIFRINSSAYVNFPVLRSLVADLPSSGFLGGNVEAGRDFWGTDFVNGSGMLMSADVAEAIADFADSWDHRFLDDVATGIMASRLGVPISPLPSPTFLSFEDLRRTPVRLIRQAHHMRLRFAGTMREDCEALRYLHRLLMS